MTQYIIIAIIAIAIFLIWTSSAQSIEPFTVISAHDGDTITAKDKQGNKFNIRFAVVDANEDSNHLRQSGGEQATNYLRSILPVGSKVSLQFTGNTSHNRTVATVYKGGVNINLAMVKAGHAVVDPRYLKQIPRELQDSYLDHEAFAKRQKLGRWGNKAWSAEYPWEFRRRIMSQRRQ
jgi:micrococcal nuclease